MDAESVPASPMVAVRNMVLKVLLDLMNSNKLFAQKFVSIISSQWALLFMGRNIHPQTGSLLFFKSR
jgi:hypothetical protein